jgi:hypothetical protein
MVTGEYSLSVLRPHDTRLTRTHHAPRLSLSRNSSKSTLIYDYATYLPLLALLAASVAVLPLTPKAVPRLGI